MDEEMIIIQEQEENYNETTVEDLTLDIEQTETVEYIEVDEPEEINIEIEETVGSPSVGDGNYAPLEHTHPISEIEELSNALHKLASAKDYYSAHTGFAEFRPWLKNGHYQIDDIYQGTGGVGYFVSLVTSTESDLDGNNTYIDICKKKSSDGTTEVTDVYGVTVTSSGFCGNQNMGYDLLDPTSPNRNNPSYAKVCLLGNVKVRVTNEDYLNIKNGDHVVPNALGYAQKSENNVGFKVISKGQIEGVGSAWYYVEIALVPQNDNVARVMKEIENTKTSLENVNIQLGDVSGKLEDIGNSNIQLGEDFKGLQDLVNESTNNINTQLSDMDQVLQDAKDTADKASKKINEATLKYAEAVSKADDAKDLVDGALATVNKIKQELDPLAQWQEDGTSNIAGFVAQANRDSTTLATITQAYGTDLTGIIQKIDDNGAVIQHLVTHVDKYTLGKYSPAYGLSVEETAILQPGIIYVPTEDHNEETKKLELGKSYMWKIGDTPDVYTWVYYKPVSTNTEEFNGIEDGDLWYCWQGVMNPEGNKYIYSPGTLYHWDDTGSGLWIAVASANDKSARAIGLINQTAEKLTSIYTDLEDNVSILKQEVDRIDAIVTNTDSGAVSKLEQTAEEIRLGVYDTDDGNATSFGLLLDGIMSVSNYGGRVCIKHVIDSSPITSDKYTQSPMWNGEKFIFAEGALSKDGIYYPHPDDDTKYCKVVSDGYEVYTIGNESRALLQTKVDEHESAIKGFTEFKTTTDSRITSVEQISNANEAKIASVAAGEYVICSDINLDPTEEDVAKIPSTRYTSAPKWVEDKFVFSEDDASADGAYYTLEGEDLYYYKLLFDAENNIVGYEQYEIASSGSAAIMQKVSENSGAIEMMVENVGKDGEVTAASIIASINEDNSEVSINADKIDLTGYVTIESLAGNGTTIIDGSNITTGVIKSNNYTEPLEGNVFAQKGTKFDLTDGSINSKNFNLSTDGDLSIMGKITATSGYIGNGINGFEIGREDLIYKYVVRDVLSAGDYYFNHNNTTYAFNLTDAIYVNSEIILNCNTPSITVDGTTVELLETAPEGAILLTGQDISTYYLSYNSQTSLQGSLERGSVGMYLGPRGLGLGHGNFGVLPDGTVQTRGKFQMFTSDDDSSRVLEINETEGIILNGNINLDGNITLGGSITWDAENSPMRVLYAKTELTTPSKTWLTDEGNYNYVASSSGDEWHRVYQQEEDASRNLQPDYYASYSYDGGETWTEAMKIRGEDGTSGTDGSDANVTQENVFNALTDYGDNQGIFGCANDDTTDIYINATYIKSGVLRGREVISATDDNNNVVSIDNGYLYLYPDGMVDESGSNKIPKLKIGCNTSATDQIYPFIQLGAGTTGTESNTTLGYPNTPGTGLISKDAVSFSINFFDSTGGVHGIHFYDNMSDVGIEPHIAFSGDTVDFTGCTTVDFTDCDVKGLEGSSGTTVAVFG